MKWRQVLYKSDDVQLTEELKNWREVIAKEVRFVDKKPFSHNIISIALQAIANSCGKEHANAAIQQFGLEKLGWKLE